MTADEPPIMHHRRAGLTVTESVQKRLLSSASDFLLVITNHHTLHPASPTFPVLSLVGFNTLPSRFYLCSILSTPFPSLRFSQGQFVRTVDSCKNTLKSRYCQAMRYLLDSDYIPDKKKG